MCIILREILFPMDYIAFLTGLTQYIPTSQRLGNFQDCVSDMGVKLQALIDGIPAELASPKSTAFLDNCIEFALTQLYHGKISYDEFARRIGMSRPHLNRRIRSLTGLTITEFLLHLRIFVAKILLDGTTCPANLIAEHCGMSTPSYFGVVFKKATGMTPEGYRNRKDNIHDLNLLK